MTKRRDYDDGAWIQGDTARIPARGEPFGGPVVVDDTPPEIKEHLKKEEYNDGLFYEVENLAQLYGEHHTTLAEARKTMPLADAKGFRDRTLKAYDADVLAKAEGAPTDEARQRFTDGAMDLRGAFDTMTTETESIFHDTKRRSTLGIKAGALARQAQAYPEDYAMHAAMLDKVVAGAAPLVKPEAAAKFRAVEAEKMARSAVMGFIEQGRFDEGRALLATATGVNGSPGALPLPPDAVKELGGILEERHGQATAREERLDRVDTVLEGTAGPTDDPAEWEALVEEHYQVVATQMAELKPVERIEVEDDYVRNLGYLPKPLTRSLRAGMLSGEADQEAAAALRLKTLADHNPALIEAIPEDERARAAAIAEFAELGLKPERAVELGEKKLAETMLEAAEPEAPGGDFLLNFNSETEEDVVIGGVKDDDLGTGRDDLSPRDLNREDTAKDIELRQAVRDRAEAPEDEVAKLESFGRRLGELADAAEVVIGHEALGLVMELTGITDAKEAGRAFGEAYDAFKKGKTAEGLKKAAKGAGRAFLATPTGRTVKVLRLIERTVRMMEKASKVGSKSKVPVRLPDVSRTRDPMTPDAFRKLPDSGTIDPFRIRSAQDSVRKTFRDRRSLEEMIEGLRSGKVRPEDTPPIVIVEADGKVITLDHRRLVAFREAGINIHYRKATLKEIWKALKKQGKETTIDDGMSIRIRKGENK